MNDADRTSQFCGVLERMIATLEVENSALRERRAYQVAELSGRKTMALYELEKLGGKAEGRTAMPQERLGYARKLLKENQALLKVNITGLADLIDMLRTHELGDESDGTYSAQILAGQGGAR